MINPIAIWKSDRESYYDFTTKELASVWPRYLTIIIFSAILAFLIAYPDGDFLQTLVSALAVLLGFSFGAQFLLVDRDFVPDGVIESIEDEAIKIKIKMLARELFDNIAFFNLMCLAAIAVSCSLLLSLEIPIFIQEIINYEIQYKLIYIIKMIGKFLLFVFLIETVWTFLRLLGRVNYLFHKVRGRQNSAG
jgi:uncharacterized membrane protein